MKQVFKCDFCGFTHNNDETLLIHESKCENNPLIKKCPTCKNQWVSASDLWQCKIKLDVGNTNKFGNCDGWEKRN